MSLTDITDIASSGLIAASVVGLTFASGIAGMIVRGRLPDRIMTPVVVDVIKLITGLLATMVALVLGLLINSANNVTNTQEAELELLAARALEIDRTLALYGPEAQPGRDLLKRAMIAAYQRYWGQETATALKVRATPTNVKMFTDFLTTLQPTTDIQRRLWAKAFDTTAAVAESRLLMSIQTTGTVSSPFLAILVSWLTLLFLGFGVVGRPSIAVAVAMAVGAFALGSAVFLILDLGQPFTGIVRLSPAPLLEVIEVIGR